MNERPRPASRGKALSPERRRRGVVILQERYRASERFLPGAGAASQHPGLSDDNLVEGSRQTG